MNMKQFRFLPLAEEPESVPILEFSTDKLSTDAYGGILSVDVRANVPYEVVMPQEADWLTHVTPAQEDGQTGSPSAVFSFEVGKNTAGSERTAAVIIRSTVGMLADTLDICQSGLADDADITAEFDPGFAAVLQELDYISDARRITREDVKGITKLNVGHEGLASLKGIEYFTALTGLSCYRNQLTSLDVSKNTALTGLDCHTNQLTSLDVSKNTVLRHLFCYKNPGQDGYFDVTRWPGSTLTAALESWKYDGKTVTVRYIGNE